MTIGSVKVHGSGDTLNESCNSAARAMMKKMRALGDRFYKSAAIEEYESIFKKKYEVIKEIGSGGFGIVLEAKELIENPSLTKEQV